MGGMGAASTTQHPMGVGVHWVECGVYHTARMGRYRAEREKRDEFGQNDKPHERVHHPHERVLLQVCSGRQGRSGSYLRHLRLPEQRVEFLRRGGRPLSTGLGPKAGKQFPVGA